MTNTPDFPESPTGGATATLPPAPTPPPVPQPAERRSNGWSIFFGIVAAVMAATAIAVIALFAIGAAIIAGIASGDIEIETDQVEVGLVPTSLDELPSSIVEDSADIEVDLTKLDISELQATDTPFGLDVEADFGSITVIVPDELDVSVDASSDLGDVTVFGDSADGFGNTLIRQNEAADITLELDLDVGTIEVIRG